jgi:hypothetical protein
MSHLFITRLCGLQSPPSLPPNNLILPSPSSSLLLGPNEIAIPLPRTYQVVTRPAPRPPRRAPKAFTILRTDYPDLQVRLRASLG